jgi:hypothetical protein
MHQRGCSAQASWLPGRGGEVGVGRHQAPVIHFIDLWRQQGRCSEGVLFKVRFIRGVCAS